jgi:hypothetical protein
MYQFISKVGEILKSIEVVFCGNSVYLCGLAAGLQKVEQLRTRLIEVSMDKAINELKMLRPEVVVLEVANYSPNWESALRRDNPCLLTVMIYPETDSLEIISGGQQLVSSVEELARVIVEQTVVKPLND